MYIAKLENNVMRILSSKILTIFRSSKCKLKLILYYKKHNSQKCNSLNLPKYPLANQLDFSISENMGKD